MVYVDSFSAGNKRTRQFDPIAKRELGYQNACDCIVRTILSEWGEFHTTIITRDVFQS